MSFIVQIIDAALPSDATQRHALIDKLVEENDANDTGPGLALGQLYQELVMKCPCLSTYKEDEVDDCVWGDGPLIGNFGQRIAVLDIVQNEEQVMAWILKLAGELNLKVVDLQTDVVYYPKSDVAISYISAQEKPVAKEKPLTEKSILDFIVNCLTPSAESSGFVWKKKEKWFQRDVAYGAQCIWLGVEKKRDKFEIYFTARFDILLVGEVVRQLTNDPSANSFIGCQEEYFTNKKIPPAIRNIDDLVLVAKSIEELTKLTVLPFFETTLALEELSKAINNSEKCGGFLGSFAPEALSLAYLVQPTKIKEVVEIYRRYIKSRNYSEEAYLKPIEDIVNKLIELNPTL